jgi:hypothetical protein
MDGFLLHSWQRFLIAYIPIVSFEERIFVCFICLQILIKYPVTSNNKKTAAAQKLFVYPEIRDSTPLIRRS